MLDPKAFVENAYYRGRVALYALLEALGIQPGAEVVLQGFTCLAVPEAVMAIGAKPVYADIEPEGFNLDPADLERKLTAKTRAIIVQHTFGIPANMEAIMSVARTSAVPVIEDCCHTLASTYRKQRVGTLGIGAFYSYEWGKPIVVAIGGSGIANQAGLASRLEHNYANYHEPRARSQLRLNAQYVAHRLLYRPSFFWPVKTLYHWLGRIGAAERNYNPVSQERVAEDFSLRMAQPLRRRLAVKMRRLADITRHSREIAGRYRREIKSDAVVHPTVSGDAEPVFARYPLRAVEKPALLKAARKANVELSEWYATPVHPLAGEDLRKVHYQPGSCPEVERRCREIVSLPTHLGVGRRDIDRAVRLLAESK